MSRWDPRDPGCICHIGGMGRRADCTAHDVIVPEPHPWDGEDERYSVLVTPGDAHREWHLNAGVPMGQPGCPQDACHPADEYDESDWEAAMRDWDEGDERAQAAVERAEWRRDAGPAPWEADAAADRYEREQDAQFERW